MLVIPYKKLLAPTQPFAKPIEAKLLKLLDSCVVKTLLVQHFSIHMEQNLINDDLIRQLCASHDRALSQQQFVNTELLSPGVCHCIALIFLPQVCYEAGSWHQQFLNLLFTFLY